MPSHAGRIEIHGQVSYAPQEAWVFSGSVKHNILFGQPLDVKRYTRVLRACSLEHDLQQWTFYDETLVGEKGVVLSGKYEKNTYMWRLLAGVDKLLTYVIFRWSKSKNQLG